MIPRAHCGNLSRRRPLEQDGIYRLHLVCGQLKIEGEVPIRPILGGFVINTLFYAAALPLLTYGPFFLRRAIRLRRGHCPACSYPVGESPVCTECGRALVNRAAVS